MPPESKALGVLAQRLTLELETMILRFMGPRASQHAEALELKPREVMLLAMLEQRGPQPMSAVAQAFGLPLSTATHQVDRLAEQGLVRRERSEEDRRVVTIQITGEGRALGERLRQGRLEMSTAMLRLLSPGERQLLVELFAKMNAAGGPEE